MGIRWIIPCALLFMAGCAANQSEKSFSGSVGDIEILAQWPDAVRETSGLALHDGLKWTINDSGDDPIIYALNENHEIEREVLLKQAVNIDWESLAQDSDYLYVADCGNNRATRSSFVIYKISWQALSKGGLTATPEIMKVTYSDFANTKPGKNHNFDCEALTVVGDELWLFTKNRADLKTKLYRLSKVQSQQFIKPSGSYDVNGLITAADYNPKTKQLALLGYGKNVIFGQSFVWIVPVDSLPVWEHAKRIKLSPYAQWEALSWDLFADENQLILSSERSPLLDVSVGRLRIPSE